MTANILLKNTQIQTIFSNPLKQVSYTYSTSGPCTLVTVLSVFVQFNYNDSDGLLDQYVLTISLLILHMYSPFYPIITTTQIELLNLLTTWLIQFPTIFNFFFVQLGSFSNDVYSVFWGKINKGLLLVNTKCCECSKKELCLKGKPKKTILAQLWKPICVHPNELYQ